MLSLRRVDCLITVEPASGRSIVRVVGRLTADQVPDLQQALDAKGASSATIDLTDLVSTDPVGLHALRTARLGGASLTNIPRYLESVLAT